jgi:hypothetical protein
VIPKEAMTMARAAVPTSQPQPAPIPLRKLLPWAIFAGVLILAVLYLVGAEQGSTSIISGHWIHEFMHDGRHLAGFPCH